jgi:aminomethyltransferase
MKNVYTDHAEEYAALRGACGLVEHSDAGLVEVSGPGAAGYLGAVTTRSVDFLLEGQSTTALLLTAAGSVVAEVLVHCRAEGYLVQVWPAQAGAARAHLLAAAREHPDATVTDVGDRHAVLGLEGPTSFTLVGGYLDFPISSMAYRTNVTVDRAGAPMFVSRTGVTGEFGYALIVPVEQAEGLRAELLAAGAVQCGLDAVDTCRMEMRFVNLEREGGEAATPFHLGLQWMVDFAGEFTGRDGLQARWDAGIDRTLVCWVDEPAGPGDPADPAPPQGGLPLTLGPTTVGEVAHAVYSPTLGRVVGTARVDGAVAASGLSFTAGDRTVRTVSAPFLVATSFGISMD